MDDSVAVLLLGSIGALVAAATICLIFFIPAKFWVLLSGVTAPAQLHSIPIAGIYPSMSLLASLMSFGSVSDVRHLFRHIWFLCALLLFVSAGVSLIWSPDLRLGLRYLIYQLPFFLLCMSMRHLATQDRLKAWRILEWTLLAGSVQAVAVILFRVMPSLETQFLSSPFAGIFVSPNALFDVFVNANVNIRDAGKSGGLFIYSNSAAAFLGLYAVAAWYVGTYRTNCMLKAAAILSWTAVLFTGSKAGAIAAVSIPVAMLLLDSGRSRKLNPTLLSSSLFAGAGAVAFLAYLGGLEKLDEFSVAATHTLQSREFLWKFALEELRSNFWLGLGFGGWELVVPVIGRHEGLQAHNTFFVIWSQSGLLAVVAAFGFAYSLLFWAVKKAFHGNDDERVVAHALFGGALWLLFQAQGENFWLIGEPHMTPLLAMLAGFLAGTERTLAAGTDAGIVGRSMRFSGEPNAIGV